jgi:hypothetical protein
LSFGLAALFAVGCARSLDAPEGEVLLSLLAVGDTGLEPGEAWLTNTQLAVAAAMGAEDRRRPADALLFLGDNFYPVGLQRHELEERIRWNLVQPYCRFLASSGPRWPEVSGRCAGAAAERGASLPIYAVLGNHDRYAKESPELQREVLPEFVANWTLPREEARSYELARGVSLILIDSMDLHSKSDARRLSGALRSAKGPWRILVAHVPLVPMFDEAPYHETHRQTVQQVLAEVGVPVQLMLAGHDHSLQVIEQPPPWPALTAVAGGGCCPKKIRTLGPGIRFAESRPGFARIDLVERDGEERLAVSLFAAPGTPLLPARPRRIASWSVDRSGRLRDESHR